MGAERLKHFPGYPQSLTPLEAAATNPAMLDAVMDVARTAEVSRGHPCRPDLRSHYHIEAGEG